MESSKCKLENNTPKVQNINELTTEAHLGANEAGSVVHFNLQEIELAAFYHLR